MNITISIDKSRTLADVARVTSYTGAKMTDADPGAYDRISTVDADAGELLRFWAEARDRWCKAAIRLIASDADTDTEYSVTLSLSESFDTALVPTMQSDLANYFCQALIARWYVYTNSAEAEAYRQRSEQTLDDIRRKALYKQRPSRPRF